METALERLSKIKDIETFNEWCDSPFKYIDLVSDVQEVVALAKANQQPSIDDKRFEAAKAAMQGLLSNSQIDLNAIDTGFLDYARTFISVGDALIAELQKPKP